MKFWEWNTSEYVTYIADIAASLVKTFDPSQYDISPFTTEHFLKFEH